MNLQHALTGGEIARRRDLLEQRFDVGAQELERTIAGLADEMEVPRMPVRMFEAESPFAEVYFARDPGVDHPLQRAVDGRTAHARRRDRRIGSRRLFASNQFDEIVGGQMSLLPEEHIDDEIAFAGAFTAGRTKAVEIGGWFHRARTVHRLSLTS